MRLLVCGHFVADLTRDETAKFALLIYNRSKSKFEQPFASAHSEHLLYAQRGIYGQLPALQVVLLLSVQGDILGVFYPNAPHGSRRNLPHVVLQLHIGQAFACERIILRGKGVKLPWVCLRKAILHHLPGGQNAVVHRL